MTRQNVSVRFSFVSAMLLALGLALALAWGWWRHEPVPMAERATGVAPASIAAPTVSLGAGLVRRDIVLMGSLFRFVVEAAPARANPALDAAVSRLRRAEANLSSWRRGSSVMKLNANAGVKPVEIDADTYRLLQLSKRLHEATNGAFDVTIGAVWDLWPFRDPSRDIPTREQLDAALELVDASAIELQSAPFRAFLPRKGMRVNFGAIGKGYAAQLAMDVLQARGVERAAISAGGDLYLRGRKSSGPWVVGIDNPAWPGRFIERFGLSDVAVATSSDTKRRVVRKGKIYGHILDPRTGEPPDHIQSATVITANPTIADAYATAVYVMGPEKGMDWVEARPGVEALVVDSSGLIHRSSGWSRVTGQLPPEVAEREPSEPEPAKPNAIVLAGRLTRLDPDEPARDFSGGAPAARTTSEEMPRQTGRPVNARIGDMVAVPAGKFRTAPGKERYVDTFRIDRTEVTNRAYAAFMEATKNDPHRFCHPDEPADKDHTPRYWRNDWQPALLRRRPAGRLAPFDLETFRKPDHPVVGVDWWDAFAFSRWAGKDLPDRWQWQKAATGPDGRRWPWGDQWDPGRVNSGGEMNGERDDHIYAAPADSFPSGVSPYGSLHMAGNVAEWTVSGLVMGGSSRDVPSDVSAASGRWRDPDYRSFDVGIRAVAKMP
jgi:thiamine biosynthesis lipoprotein